MAKWENNIATITIPTPFPVGDVNSFLIKGDALTLIDAGPKTAEAEQALNEALRELHLDKRDIDQIIITHHHPDHVGGVDFFSSELPLIGHEENNRWLNMTNEVLNAYNQFYYQLGQDMGLPEQYSEVIDIREDVSIKFICNRSALTDTLGEGDDIPGLHGWKVFETPGHAQSHIILFRESDGLVIGGDLLLQHVSPNPIIEPPMTPFGDRAKSQLLLNESLLKLSELPISFVYAGHSERIDEPKELIQRRLASQHGRAMRVRSMLEEKPSTVFEICKKLFPKVYKKQLGLTLSETMAQIDYLLNIDAIVGEKREYGIVYDVK